MTTFNQDNTPNAPVPKENNDSGKPKKNESQEELITGSIGKLLLKYTLPTLFAMMVSAIYTVIDSVFIGKYSTASLSSVSVFMILEMLITLVAQGFCGSGGTLLAKASGANDKEGMHISIAVTIKILLVFSILVTGILLPFIEPIVVLFGARNELKQDAVDYGKIILAGGPIAYSGLLFVTFMIRTLGKPGVSMLFAIASSLLNIGGDAILIFSCGLGVKGAAYSTLISQIVIVPFGMWYLLKKCDISLKWRHFFRWDGDVAGKIVLLSLASSFPGTLWNVVNIMINNQIHHYADPDDVTLVLAVIAITSRLTTFVLIGVQAMAMAGGIIWSSNLGARLYSRIKKAVLDVCLVQWIVCMIGWIIFQLFPSIFLKMFADKDDIDAIVVIGKTPFKIMMGAMFVRFGSLTAVFMYQSLIRPLVGICMALIRRVVLYMGLISILPGFMGLDGVYWTFPIADVISCIIGIILIVVGMSKLPEDGKPNSDWDFMVCKCSTKEEIIFDEESSKDGIEMKEIVTSSV
ncbi:Multi antimicrobial extrusion protein like protein [Aduncisulcus paluster]|uniref:Multi antimicrobial extrusion protein like protein n=1 Tax=Aduncisulcus paluster TaxID=2918883 RepID=A0ABQ5K6U6_9EUKA|nr:Multi antimicrobial extrusion protein like protein [Aduncisulcus paluster]